MPRLRRPARTKPPDAYSRALIILLWGSISLFLMLMGAILSVHWRQDGSMPSRFAILVQGLVQLGDLVHLVGRQNDIQAQFIQRNFAPLFPSLGERFHNGK